MTFGLPTPRHVGLPTPPEAPAVESSEPAAEAPPTAVPSEPAAEAPQIVAVAEPAVPAAVEIPPAAPALVEATLTSRVGTGTTALTAVLVVLITGIWLYGNRLASHLTRRNDHA